MNTCPSRCRRRLVAWCLAAAAAGLAAFVGWRVARSDGQSFSVTRVSGDLDGVLAYSEQDVSFCVHNSGRGMVRVIGLSRG
jgi:hypothetical protein